MPIIEFIAKWALFENGRLSLLDVAASSSKFHPRLFPPRQILAHHDSWFDYCGVAPTIRQSFRIIDPKKIQDSLTTWRVAFFIPLFRWLGSFFFAPGPIGGGSFRARFTWHQYLMTLESQPLVIGCYLPLVVAGAGNPKSE